MSLKKFFTKHAVELGTIASVIGDVVSLLPIGRQDKRRISQTVDTLNKAADSIAKSAERMKEGAEDIDREALKEVLREILPDMLGGIVETKTRAATRQRKKPATETAPQENKG